MGQQLSYIRHKKLGYDRDHVLELPMNRSLLANFDYFKAEFLRNPDIISMTHCGSSPVSIIGGYDMRSSTMAPDHTLAVFGDPIDPDFVKTTGVEIIAGNNITEQDMLNGHPVDTATKPEFAFILNETAARALGWTPQEAVGKRMFMDGSRPGFVKGVVKDFNFQSLHIPIKGLILFPSNRSNKLLMRITGEHLPQTLSFIESKWKALVPAVPYEVHFLDESYNQLYASEQRLGKVMNLFSGIAIVLACLGLFGLSSYAAKQRVKEIGIRKVLGASLGHLAMLLSAGFVRLALVAILIAVPLAAWAMHRWLQDFVYRTTMEWWIFALAAVLVLGITLATVSIQAVKTALLNPVKNLKVE
jgi:putative ABC transport system permease protein